MSNLVGLWATMTTIEGKMGNTVFIYGKADDYHYLVQAICGLSGSPNVMKIATIEQMKNWVFYADPEWITENRNHVERCGSPAYTLKFPSPQQ